MKTIEKGINSETHPATPETETRKVQFETMERYDDEDEDDGNDDVTKETHRKESIGCRRESGNRKGGRVRRMGVIK